MSAELRQRAVMLAALAARVAQERGKVGKALRESMDELSTVRVTIPNPDPEGDPIVAGRVEYRAPRRSLTVYDEQAFVRWLEEWYTSEVVFRKTYEPAFLGQFRIVNGQVVGPSGEMDVPGLGVLKGDASVAVVPDKNAADQLWAFIRDQRTELLP